MTTSVIVWATTMPCWWSTRPVTSSAATRPSVCNVSTPAPPDGVEKAQVAVYLASAAPAGHTLIDRALYLPQGWVDDPDRCATAGIPTDVAFATKPALATRMITAALDAGVPASWVAGDEVYGADPTLRSTLRARGGRVRVGRGQQPAHPGRQGVATGR